MEGYRRMNFTLYLRNCSMVITSTISFYVKRMKNWNHSNVAAQRSWEIYSSCH